MKNIKRYLIMSALTVVCVGHMQMASARYAGDIAAILKQFMLAIQDAAKKSDTYPNFQKTINKGDIPILVALYTKASIDHQCAKKNIEAGAKIGLEYIDSLYTIGLEYINSLYTKGLLPRNARNMSAYELAKIIMELEFFKTNFIKGIKNAKTYEGFKQYLTIEQPIKNIEAITNVEAAIKELENLECLECFIYQIATFIMSHATFADLKKDLSLAHYYNF